MIMLEGARLKELEDKFQSLLELMDDFRGPS